MTHLGTQEKNALFLLPRPFLPPPPTPVSKVPTSSLSKHIHSVAMCMSYFWIMRCKKKKNLLSEFMFCSYAKVKV